MYLTYNKANHPLKKTEKTKPFAIQMDRNGGADKTTEMVTEDKTRGLSIHVLKQNLLSFKY